MLTEEELYRKRQQINRARQQARAKKRRKQLMQKRMRIVMLAAVITIGMICLVRYVTEGSILPRKVVQNPPEYVVDLLDINEYSRPGYALDEVKGIVIHYTANPGTTAKQNRDYFNGLQYSHETNASAHFVIGLDGEIVQCIPCNEVAYASNSRNYDTIAIECCHPDATGEFTNATRETLVHLVAWLVGRYDLSVEDVIRHYDVSGKKCPLYYVDNPKEWQEFKEDVEMYIRVHGSREG